MGDIAFSNPVLKRLESRGEEAIGLFAFSEKRPLSGINGLLDWRLLGRISRLVIEGFLRFDEDEKLLFPLGGRMPQRYLVLIGLGPRAGFDRRRFGEAVRRLFKALDDLGCEDTALSLPGRVEDVCEPADAIEWFLESVENAGDRNLAIIEPTGVQAAMAPVVERWRLKRSLP
ncbi:MAG: M17 family peptidase N-terminal domain-containing protein [Polyangia bacterium]